MKPTSRQGETTKGSERMKTSLGPTVAKEMQIKASVMSFFPPIRSAHTQTGKLRLCGNRSPGSSLLRDSTGSLGQNDLTHDSQRPGVLKCCGNVGGVWGIQLSIQLFADLPGTGALGIALFMKVKHQV